MRRTVLCCALVALFMVAPLTAEARTWHIMPDATGDAPTIQAGIDSSAAGDTVLLADGTYRGVGNREIRYHGKDVVIRSESGDWSTCTVSAYQEEYDDYRGFIFDSGEDAESILEGVTVSGCGYYYAPGLDGAGVYCSGSSPTIRNVRLSHNFGFNGGGMACYDASPVLECVTFLYNHANSGGGMFCGAESAPVLRDVHFTGNVTGYYWSYGGGMTCVDASPVLEDVSFIGNESGFGGGMFCQGQSAPILRDVEFRGNEALTSVSYGGGMLVTDGAEATLRRATFTGNRADQGAGIFCWESSIIDLTTCLFLRNAATDKGGAVLCDRSSIATVTGTTFVLNEATSGSAIYCCKSALTMNRVLVSGNTGGAAVQCDDLSNPGLWCCDLFGNRGGDWVGRIADQYGVNGNFSADPRFCDADGGSFVLEDCSPCLPGHHPTGYDCRGAIGVYGEGCQCGDALEPTTWGQIKASYR